MVVRKILVMVGADATETTQLSDGYGLCALLARSTASIILASFYGIHVVTILVILQHDIICVIGHDFYSM